MVRPVLRQAHSPLMLRDDGLPSVVHVLSRPRLL